MPDPPTIDPSAEGLLGPLEHQAMQALWENAPASVNDVLKRINRSRPAENRLAYTTVMTVLVRLTEKGLVDRSKVGRGYAYTPNFSEPELVDHLSRRDIAALVDRYGAVALTQFAAALQEADPTLLARITTLAEGGEDG